MRAVERSQLKFCEWSVEPNLKRSLATQNENEADGYDVSVHCETDLKPVSGRLSPIYRSLEQRHSMEFTELRYEWSVSANVPSSQPSNLLVFGPLPEVSFLIQKRDEACQIHESGYCSVSSWGQALGHQSDGKAADWTSSALLPKCIA